MKKFIENSKDRKVFIWDQNKQLFLTWEVVKGWRRGERKATFNVTGIFSGSDPGRSWTKEDAVNQLNWIVDYMYIAVLDGKKEHRKNKDNKNKLLDELPVVQKTWMSILTGRQIIPERKAKKRYLRQFKI